MPLLKNDIYTIEDIYALPEGRRAELIDGHIYDMALPSPLHQELVQQLSRTIGNYIESKSGTCKVYPAPFAVFIKDDDTNYVEPDISVICDKSKISNRGCEGAPDFVIDLIGNLETLDYKIADSKELLHRMNGSAGFLDN